METRELKESIKHTKNAIKLLETEKDSLIESFKYHCKPSGYKSATSYIDADLIYTGYIECSLEILGKKIDEINAEIMRLEESLKVDELLLYNKQQEKMLDEKLKVLNTNKEKALFLVKVCGFTQKAAAEKLDITEQRVYQICREDREK